VRRAVFWFHWNIKLGNHGIVIKIHNMWLEIAMCNDDELLIVASRALALGSFTETGNSY
jgi:hypothetical protein